MRGEGALCRYGGRHRVGRPAEGDEERVALRIHDPAAVRVHRGAQQSVVLGEHVGVTVAELLKQPGGALDVGEQERHRPDRQLSHRDASCHAR